MTRQLATTQTQAEKRHINSAPNPQILARKAGILYLLLAPLGIFGLIYVPELILAIGNPEATFANIVANEQLFRWGILAAFAIQVIQLFVALALYDLLKPVNKRIASLIVFFTLAAMPIALLNELSHVAILYLVNNAGFAAAFSTEQVQQMVMFLINLNSDGIMIAHIFWGFWLFPMGYLIAKSDFLPKSLGWLFMLACCGYLADTVIWMLAPESTFSVAEFTGWGELILPFWLIIKGVKGDNWQRWAKTPNA